MNNVLKFDPVVVGSGYRFKQDQILDEAKGTEFALLCVLGEDSEGDLYVAGNANAGEIMILLERAKKRIVFGEGA